MIIPRKDALNLISMGAMEELGIIVWASDLYEARQDLYRAVTLDSQMNSNLEFRIVAEGIAICHPPHHKFQNMAQDPSEADPSLEFPSNDGEDYGL